MSLQNDNRKHRRTVVTQKGKGTLTLSSELIKQVHYMHTVVENGTEWSGILIYEVISGDVDNTEEFVLHAHELVPMDVGSSGYTEYEFDPADEYSFERIATALEEGKKIGHIHTHHNMGTFFSGTDMSELHDNAPNHNFYLSLIVDYKNHGDWCAKVAVDGEEVTTGTVKTEGFFKRSGIVKTVTKWKGHNGDASVEQEKDYGKDEDYTGEEEVEVTKPMLFVIDMDIELDEAGAEWEDRVESLNSKRSGAYTGYSTYSAKQNFQNIITGKQPWEKINEEKNAKKSLNNPSTNEMPKGVMIDISGDNFPTDDVDPQYTIEYDELDSNPTPQDRPDNFFTPGDCRTLLGNFLTLDPAWNGDLDEAITTFNNEVVGSQVDEAIWLSQFEDNCETWASHAFNLLRVEQEDMHCIAYALFALLEPYKALGAFRVLEDALEIYILPDAFIDDALVYRLTGIEITEG